MDTIKNILIGTGIIGALTLGGMAVGGGTPTIQSKATTLKSTIDTQQINYQKQYGTYAEIPETISKDGIKYRVDEIKEWGGTSSPKAIRYEVHMELPDGSTYEGGVFLPKITSVATSTK